MVRLNVFTASLLARKSIQARHQRRSLGLNESVFMVFVIVFVFVKYNLCHLWNLCDLYPTIRVICASKNKSRKPIKHNFQQQSAPSRFTRIAQTKTNQTSLRNSAFSPIFANHWFSVTCKQSPKKSKFLRPFCQEKAILSLKITPLS